MAPWSKEARSSHDVPRAHGHGRPRRGRRGTNVHDGGAPYYVAYETADTRWFTVGAVEPQFYAELLDGLGLDEEDLPDRSDRTQWPELRARLAAAFRSRTRDEWTVLFDGTDACATPVLLPSECPDHPQHRARSSFIDVGGVPTSAGAAIVPHARSSGRAPGGSVGLSGEYRPGSAWQITRCRSTVSSAICMFFADRYGAPRKAQCARLADLRAFPPLGKQLASEGPLSTRACRCRWPRQCAPDPRHAM